MRPRRFRPQREVAQRAVIVVAVDVFREVVRASAAMTDLDDLSTDGLRVEQDEFVAGWRAFIGDIHCADRFQILSSGRVIHPNVVLFLAVFERFFSIPAVVFFA